MNIKKLIGETTEYDKKQAVEIRRPKSWLKSVSDFANGGGGYFYEVTLSEARNAGLEPCSKCY